MTARGGAVAPVIGILLILLGLAFFACLVWMNAPLEEPASPGKTPNPSMKQSTMDRWLWIIRFLQYGAIPGGGVGLIVIGTVLLVPWDRSRRE